MNSLSNSLFCYIYNCADLPPDCHRKEVVSSVNWDTRKIQMADYVLKKNMDSPEWICVKNRKGPGEFSFSTIQDFLDAYELMV